MPDLTPALSVRYRRSALVALDGLIAGVESDVALHLMDIARLTTTGERLAGARASLEFAEHRLALLQDRQRFLLTGEPIHLAGESKGSAETKAERSKRETAGEKDKAASRKATEGSRGKRQRGAGLGSEAPV